MQQSFARYLDTWAFHIHSVTVKAFNARAALIEAG